MHFVIIRLNMDAICFQPLDKYQWSVPYLRLFLLKACVSSVHNTMDLCKILTSDSDITD